jgi:hypothetical protein
VFTQALLMGTAGTAACMHAVKAACAGAACMLWWRWRVQGSVGMELLLDSVACDVTPHKGRCMLQPAPQCRACTPWFLYAACNHVI